MVRKAVTLALFTVALVWIAAPARAQSPHFLSAADSINTGTGVDGGDLTVTWKESGLGNNALIAYLATANGTAVYACVNGGGNHPSASNKMTVNGPVSASGTFSSGKNGAIVASLIGEEPGPASTFTCPGGQTFVLASVSYTDIVLADSTNGVTELLADVSVTFCDINNLTKATLKNCAVVD